MVCRVCNEFSQQADKESPFYLGTSTFRKSSIKTHATSKAHAKCELAKRAFRKLYPQSRSRKFAHAGFTIKGLYLSVFRSFISI